MDDKHRVFITGLSALTAPGVSLKDTWTNIIEGKTTLRELTQWDISSWSHRLGAQLTNFQPAKNLPDRKLMKMISPQDALGINAAMQAIEQSQLISYRNEQLKNDAQVTSFNERTGVFVGSPGNKYYQQYDFLSLIAKSGDDMNVFASELFQEVHPMWLLRILPNNVLAYTGITYGFKGVNHNITNHAVGGMQAIIEAYYAIQSGLIDRAVVVAYDIATEPQALFYYTKLGVISARHLKPFDVEHDGTLLGDGAAALILESERSANRRGMNGLAEILSGVSASECAGLFSIEEDGTQLAALLSNTLNAAKLTPADIGFIIAHGNGNIKSDLSEAQAIQRTFKNNCPPVTAFKWAMGHTICASGVLDAVLATEALQQKCIPGIANFNQAAVGCEKLSLSATHREVLSHQATALVINRGFGSMNACLVIKACDSVT